jgi:hypothetical protein
MGMVNVIPFRLNDANALRIVYEQSLENSHVSLHRMWFTKCLADKWL